MPYKDPEHKKNWEVQHRAQRRARRRELRRDEAAYKAAHPEAFMSPDSGVGYVWIPVAGGVALAAYSHKLAIGAGGLTLAAAAAFKKSWVWWMIGALLLALGLLFQWNTQNKNEAR